MSWVVTAYMLAETISTVLAGKFGDLFGRKRVFQLGVAVFIVGSFFCGLSTSMVMLIAFRAVQGLGGGALTVTSTACPRAATTSTSWPTWSARSCAGRPERPPGGASGGRDHVKACPVR